MTILFGSHIRKIREERLKLNRRFSLRQVAERVAIEPAYLSKIERGIFPPPSEQVIVKLARELDESPDYLLALAGKISSDLVAAILERPDVMAGMIRVGKELSSEEIEALFKQRSRK